MILAAAHAGAYRAVEPHNAALTPSQLRNAAPRSPRSTASTVRAGSSRRVTHRLPGSTAVALRISHRGHGIRRTPRRAPTTATALHRKTALPGEGGSRSRRPQ